MRVEGTHDRLVLLLHCRCNSTLPGIISRTRYMHGFRSLKLQSSGVVDNINITVQRAAYVDYSRFDYLAIYDLIHRAQSVSV